MLAASICREVYFVVLPSTTMTSRVPRCLFGKPNPRETMEMLQEALDAERSKFAKRWGVDPCSEDKENNYQRRTNDRSEPSSNKKRSNPYSRQTSIHGEQHFSPREISPREFLSTSLTPLRIDDAPDIAERAHTHPRWTCTGREHESRDIRQIFSRTIENSRNSRCIALQRRSAFRASLSTGTRSL